MKTSNNGILEQAIVNIRKLLAENRETEALEFVTRVGPGDDRMRNALGVCLMRVGNLDAAINVYRGFCIDEGVSLKSDVSPLHLVNYATALVLKGNVGGCLTILHQLRGSRHPAADQLEAVVERWRSALPWWRRLGLKLGTYEPREGPDLGFPPGKLD